MPETRGDINLAVVGAGMGTDRRSVADTMRIFFMGAVATLRM
jgi:hypothetical protein